MLQVLGFFHLSCCIYSDATRWYPSHLVASAVAHCGNVPFAAWPVSGSYVLSGSCPLKILLKLVPLVLMPANTGAQDASAWRWALLSVPGMLLPRPQG